MLKDILQKIYAGCLQIALPNLCFGCREPIDFPTIKNTDYNSEKGVSTSSSVTVADPLGKRTDPVFCQNCIQQLTSDTNLYCNRCLSNLPIGVISKRTYSDRCGQCRAVNYSFDGAFRFGIYDGMLREAILRMKSLSGESFAVQLGKLWIESKRDQFISLNPTVVIPTPLHWTRWWKRGYNQSETLAEQIAKEMKIPLQPNWVKRIRATRKQTTVSAKERRQNVKGSFAMKSDLSLSGQSIIIVDDVFTTGTTVNEIAKLLKDHKADKIWVAVLAHR